MESIPGVASSYNGEWTEISVYPSSGPRELRKGNSGGGSNRKPAMRHQADLDRQIVGQGEEGDGAGGCASSQLETS